MGLADGTRDNQIVLQGNRVSAAVVDCGIARHELLSLDPRAADVLENVDCADVQHALKGRSWCADCERRTFDLHGVPEACVESGVIGFEPLTFEPTRRCTLEDIGGAGISTEVIRRGGACYSPIPRHGDGASEVVALY